MISSVGITHPHPLSSKVTNVQALILGDETFIYTATRTTQRIYAVLSVSMNPATVYPPQTSREAPKVWSCPETQPHLHPPTQPQYLYSPSTEGSHNHGTLRIHSTLPVRPIQSQPPVMCWEAGDTSHSYVGAQFPVSPSIQTQMSPLVWVRGHKLVQLLHMSKISSALSQLAAGGYCQWVGERETCPFVPLVGSILSLTGLQLDSCQAFPAAIPPVA